LIGDATERRKAMQFPIAASTACAAVGGADGSRALPDLLCRTTTSPSLAPLLLRLPRRFFPAPCDESPSLPLVRLTGLRPSLPAPTAGCDTQCFTLPSTDLNSLQLMGVFGGLIHGQSRPDSCSLPLKSTQGVASALLMAGCPTSLLGGFGSLQAG